MKKLLAVDCLRKDPRPLSFILCACSAKEPYRPVHPWEQEEQTPSGDIPYWAVDDQPEADARFEELLAALQGRDGEAIKSLFSEKAVSEAANFEQAVDELFEYCQGDYVSYKSLGVMTSEGFNDDGSGRRWKEFFSNYEVKTNEQTYCFDIADFIVNSDDSSVGIWALYVYVKGDYIGSTLSYEGYGSDVPGISFPARDAQKTLNICQQILHCVYPTWSLRLTNGVDSESQVVFPRREQ